MIPECDRQTVGRSDGQTESIIAKTALCIASYYADALSKIVIRCQRTLRDEGHSAACWGIGGSVELQTAGSKSVRSLIALRCLQLMLV